MSRGREEKAVAIFKQAATHWETLTKRQGQPGNSPSVWRSYLARRFESDRRQTEDAEPWFTKSVVL